MGIAVLPAACVLSLSASAAAAGTRLTTDASRMLRGCIPFGVFTVDFFAFCFVGDPREEVVRLVTPPRLREEMFPVTGLPARTGFEGFAIRHYIDIEVSHGDRRSRGHAG